MKVFNAENLEAGMTWSKEVVSKASQKILLGHKIRIKREGIFNAAIQVVYGHFKVLRKV